MQTKNSQGKPLGWSSDADWKATQDVLNKWPDLKQSLDVSRYYTNDFLPK